jgi:F0F1-type ATP synthase membrane subunit b/b'
MTADARTTGDAAQADQSKPNHENRSAEERAEEIVERFSSEATRFARRLVGRAREELEDIVAEAQSIRRGQPPPQ